jgi:hypothetical protein
MVMKKNHKESLAKNEVLKAVKVKMEIFRLNFARIECILLA